MVDIKLSGIVTADLVIELETLWLEILGEVGHVYLSRVPVQKSTGRCVEVVPLMKKWKETRMNINLALIIDE